MALTAIPENTVPDNGSDTETLNNPETNSQLEKKESSDLERQDSNSSINHALAKNRETTDKKRKLKLEKIQATGPNGFNPTNARFHVRWASDDESESAHAARCLSMVGEGTTAEVALHWSARYNRKGRNSFVVKKTPTILGYERFGWLRTAWASFKDIFKNVIHMFFTFPYWDMAFWSGWSYSWGSALFILCGAFSWAPVAFPHSEFPGEVKASGYLFFVGAMLYEIGATVAYLEAINDGSFHGSAMKKFLEGHEDDQKKLLDDKLHAFFGHFVPHLPSAVASRRKKRQLGRIANALDVEPAWDPENAANRTSMTYKPRRGGVDFGAAEDHDAVPEYLPWIWYPSLHNLVHHHMREVGWWACSIQLFGATLYGITGIVAIPGILDSLKQWQMNAAYWIPQIVASCCFLTASVLFTYETQEKWWKPEFKVLGWWVGFWACVGSMGFLLCGALGPAYGNHGAIYQSDLSSLWGSAAYLTSGLLQWYEAVNKHPIEELLNEPGAMKSFQVHPV